jgi:RNA ligase (TIGR02306 family)
MERQLATIDIISDIKPIEGADAIEVAKVRGWEVVTRKGEFNVGDKVVYLEIDSWVPHDLAPFLSKGKEPKEYKGIKGERLRTIKLRGQVSQGLILPLPEDLKENDYPDDVSELLGVTKWERELPPALQGKVKGNFPSFIPKTEQERIQNIKDFDTLWNSNDWVSTEKLHGSSVTIYYKDGVVGVCSRNLELKEDGGDAYWSTAKRLGVVDVLIKREQNVALQGELIGPGINGNQYELTETTIRFFDVFSIDNQSYANPNVAFGFVCGDLELGYSMFVPIRDYIDSQNGITKEVLLKMAEGKSMLNGSEREGLVFRSSEEGGPSFKVISNKWLLGEGE